MLSLNQRVLIAASAILSSFFGLAGVALDKIYREDAEQALSDRLQGHVYELIAVADLDANGNLKMPVDVPDSRFSDTSSGLFAQITSNYRDWKWQSASMVGMDIRLPQKLLRTETVSKRIISSSNRELYSFSYGVGWSENRDPEQAYTFTIVYDLVDFNAGVSSFRQSLWVLLGSVAIILLAVQGTILRWGLSPLRHAANELSAIEAGSQVRLQGKYPAELKGLTSNVNALLLYQQEHLERYRKNLGDLAHSLKTPLAILQNAVESHDGVESLSSVVEDQVERMNQITGYQLQRAAASGRTALAAPVLVNDLINKVLSSLQKVYADKSVNANYIATEQIEFHGDEGDLMEIIGNLVDNAFKWCQQEILVTAKNSAGSQEGQLDLLIQVDDDGSGVLSEMVQYVTRRGHRADNEIAGHGIGLSIVNDIVQVYGGTLEIGTSELGGAKIIVKLPANLEHAHQATESKLLQS
ncbi:MAG: GHKL domain-containing protein [Gammaproteobacteria bacterium]|nr:GHKL domain-containing protein [Gammaproteobacteria bacterium]